MVIIPWSRLRSTRFVRPRLNPLPAGSSMIATACLHALLLLATPLASPAADASPAHGSELGRPVVQNFLARTFGGTSRTFGGTTDDAGVLYFANGSAVLTYNGSDWERFRPTEDSFNLRGLALGPDGRIYLGGDKTLGRYHRQGMKYESLIDRLPEAERAIGQVAQIVTHGGIVFIVTAKHVLLWRDERFTLLPCAGARLHAVGDRLYVTAPKQPLRRIEAGRFIVVADDALFRERDIRFIGAGGDGRLIIGPATGGLFQLAADGKGAITPFATTADALFRSKQIYTGQQLADGSLAVAFTIATGGGAVFLDRTGRCVLQLDETSGLQDANVFGFVADRDGGLWLTLNSGLARVQWPAAFTYFSRPEGLSLGVVQHVSRHAGAIYAATSRGLYRLLPGTPPASRARFEQVFASETGAPVAWRDGLLIPTPQDVRLLASDGTISPIFKAVAPQTIAAATVSLRDPDRIWISQNQGLRSIYRTGEGWRDEGLVAGVEGNVVRVAEATDGTLWLTGPNLGFVSVRFETAEGTARAAAKITRFKEGSGLPGTVVAGEATRWGDEMVFTTSGGTTLLRFDEARQAFAPMPNISAITEPLMYQIGADLPDHLWLSVDRLSPQKWRIHRAQRGGTVQALPQTIMHPIGVAWRFLEEKGLAGDALWVGGSEGLMRVELARAFAPAAPLTVQVRGAGFTAETRRPYAQRDVDLTYFAPRFQTGSVVEYQTRLEGYEDAWSAWSPARKRTFTNLGEGRYRFVVQARDTDQLVSAPAGFAFVILPPWWRTWWAYGGYGVAFGLSLLGFAHLRNRGLIRKNERLEKTIAARTGDLRRQNGELARLHQLELDEKISARLVAEKAQLDVLRYQLNPHFLFNSLTSIRSAIPPALGAARDTLDKLADFCRLTLAGQQAEERTTVGEEMAMLRAYLGIEQTRMGELLSVEFDVDAALEEVMIPRLLLLPLVENGLKYGQVTSEDALGIRISARRIETLTRAATGKDADGIVFEIANTGTWVERGSRPGIPSTGIGHDNLRERLRRHYPDAHAFTHTVANGWVVVRVELRGEPAAR